MQIKLQQQPGVKDTIVTITYDKITESIKKIARQLKEYEIVIEAVADGKIYYLAVNEIYYIILYIPTILAAYLFHWFPMTLKGVAVNSLYYCIVMMIVHLYIYKSMQREADEINQLLNRKEE